MAKKEPGQSKMKRPKLVPFHKDWMGVPTLWVGPDIASHASRWAIIRTGEAYCHLDAKEARKVAAALTRLAEWMEDEGEEDE